MKDTVMGYAKAQSTKRVDDRDNTRAAQIDKRYGAPATNTPTKGEAVSYLSGETLLRFVTAVLTDGGCAQISSTRDGGALAITILLDGNAYKHYAASEDAWTALVAKVAGF